MCTASTFNAGPLVQVGYAALTASGCANQNVGAGLLVNYSFDVALKRVELESLSYCPTSMSFILSFYFDVFCFYCLILTPTEEVVVKVRI